jgi:hypothetical protein
MPQLAQKRLTRLDSPGSESDAADAQFFFEQLRIVNDVFDDQYVEFLLHPLNQASSAWDNQGQ